MVLKRFEIKPCASKNVVAIKRVDLHLREKCDVPVQMRTENYHINLFPFALVFLENPHVSFLTDRATSLNIHTKIK